MCGVTNKKDNRVGFHSKSGLILCGKHKAQYDKDEKFKEQTRFDKNKIEIVNNEYAKVYVNNSKGEIFDYFIIDIEDIDKISSYKWFKKKDGRIVCNITRENVGRTHIRVHNLIMEFEFNSLYELVDHIDRNPSNNRRSNLRIVDAQTNIINRGLQCNNKTGVAGVVQTKSGKYIAQLKFDRKMMRFGTYSDFKEAVLARAEAEAEYFKDRSVNYVDSEKSIIIKFRNNDIDDFVSVRVKEV